MNDLIRLAEGLSYKANQSKELCERIIKRMDGDWPLEKLKKECDEISKKLENL